MWPDISKVGVALGGLCLAAAIGVTSTALSSSPVVAVRRLILLHADSVTDEAATLVGEVAAEAAASVAMVTFYVGERDGGNRPDGWQYRLALGAPRDKRVSVSIEGLKPATRYTCAAAVKSAAGEEWSERVVFSTAEAPRLKEDTAWVREVASRQVPAHGFISLRPAARWEDSLLAGNGTVGALVFGRPLDERVIVSHERLFLPWHAPLPPLNTAPDLPTIRSMLGEGRYQDAADLVVQRSLEAGYGAKRWTDMFIPAFDIVIGQREGRAPADGAPAITHYARTVDFATGVATVRWEDERGAFLRRLFVSRADGAVVLSIGPQRLGAGRPRIDCTIELAPRPLDKVNTYWNEHGKYAEGIKSLSAGARDGWLTFVGEFAKADGGYAGAARIVVRNGSVRVDGTRMVVTGASDVLLLAGVDVRNAVFPPDGGPRPHEPLSATGPARRGAAPDPLAIEERLAALPADFERLLARHAAVHGAIFNRVSLDLGASAAQRATPSEDLIATSTIEHTSPALLEKVFDAGRYAILSSSGEWPPNLQGVWTGTWGAPWSGDYTLNGNVQVAIASLLDANMPECMLAVFRYIDGLMPASRENARRMYGTRGALIPSRASTHGFNNHFDRTWPMTFWTAGTGWMAHFYYDYYLHTGDRQFLRERALPILTAAAEFYEDFLCQDESGHYVFSPSYSPENNPRNSRSQAVVNATMDIAVAKETLRTLIDASRIVGVNAEGIARWTRMLAKMPDYQVNADGALREWTWPGLDDSYEHRHASHLYALFYGMPADFATRPALAAAARRAVALRMREREKQGGGVMGFGSVQLGQAAATLGDGESVFSLIRWLANRHYYAGFASSHDPGPEIFNSDISGGVPELIIRMLVQSEPGSIELLPALPTELRSGTIRGALTRGQVVVKELRWDGSGAIDVTLWSPRAQDVTVRWPVGQVRGVALAANTDVRLRLKR
ncbi:MAG: glycosyl hydrolase family 95 catalytic domain-containing protein [Bacteroidales bacterium]